MNTIGDALVVDKWYDDKRVGGLWRFAAAISLLNVLGYTVLGFEPAWIQPFVALAAAYTTELGIETIDALSTGRRPAYMGGIRAFVEFLLPAHITGLAIGMLLYPGKREMVIALAAAVAIASKSVFRIAPRVEGVPVAKWPSRHFLNPSNFGITVILLLFPSVSITPPYHFTEYANELFHWILPLLIVCSGSFMNIRFTSRVPLILAWACGFILQALARSVLLGNALVASLSPMTGLAFVLFSFYMVTDPATTPSRSAHQVFFGAAVAAVYGLLVAAHIAFGLFFALTIVTSVRGMALFYVWLMATETVRTERLPVPAAAR